MTDDSRVTPERMAKEVADFRELVEEAKLLRADLRGLVDEFRAVNEETRRLRGIPGDDKIPKRPELTLVKSDPDTTADDHPL